jgi:predicted amidohydrolase YtcJ
MRNPGSFAVNGLAALSLSACLSTHTDEPSTPIQLQQVEEALYFGGDILTMRGDSPEYAEALVTRDGRIVFVGEEAAARETYSDGARLVDLDGRTLLPGFIDGHGHLYHTGFVSLMANLLPPPDGPGADFASIVETMSDWTTSDDGQMLMKKTGWILGNGYDDSQLAEKAHPTADVLDRISTDRPVVVIHQSGHLAAVNHKALDLIGYTAATPDPEGGVIRRDETGAPNGVLEEAAFFNGILPQFASSQEDLANYTVLEGQKAYVKFGYTTAQDGRTTAPASAAFEQAAAQGEFFIDVVSYPDIAWNEAAVLDDFYNEEQRYTNHYRVGGIKLSLDGSPQGKTAWLSHPYHVPPEGKETDYSGYPVMPDEKAIEYITTAFRNRWQILCHANGDAAIDQFIEAVRAARSSHGYDDARPVLIHGQTLREDQIADLAELDILPSLFPMHTFYWGDWHAESVLGHPRADYISPTRDVLDAGLTLTSHHDAPVTFPNSMRVLDATVNRVTRSNVVLGPDQRLTPYEALKSLTDWAAIQYFEEDRKGTLEVGKLADLVILSDNPLKVDPLTIKDIDLEQTIKEGQTVYRRAGN